jgi:hypothetical protein
MDIALFMQIYCRKVGLVNAGKVSQIARQLPAGKQFLTIIDNPAVTTAAIRMLNAYCRGTKNESK